MKININFNDKELLNKIINILILLAVFVLLGIIIHKVFNSNVGVDKYQQGINYYNQKDYQNAYYNFVRVPKNSKYYYLALFRQGMCAEKLGDNVIQAQKFEEFVKKSQNSLTAEAAFKSGLAYFMDKKYSDAEKMFKKASKIQAGADNKISNFSIASNYYLGEILKDKNPKDALNYYLQYVQNVEDGRYSLNSALKIDEILSKNEKFVLNADENFYVAKALFDGKDYQKAQKYFDNADEQKSWYLKAQNYIKLNQKDKAIEILNSGLPQYYQQTDVKDLSVAINSLVNIYSPDKQATWKLLYDRFKDTDISVKDEIYYNLGLYKEIYEEELKGEFALNSLSQLFFNAYKNKDYILSRVYGDAFIERFNNAKTAPKILYYLAKTYEQSGKKIEATQAYNRLIVNYPDSFWAFRAYAKVKNGKSKLAKFESMGYSKIDVNQRVPQFPYSEIALNNKDVNLLNDLIKIKDYDLIEKLSPDNIAVRSWTNYKSGNYSLSTVLARDYLNEMETKPDFQDDLYLLAYPIMYKDVINRNIEINNLNGFLIESLIREESYFNPNAKSSVGALGLMQLMPQTASFIMNQDVSKSKLLEPEYNIALGVKYYNYVKRTLNNNNVYAVLAYNGGPGAVQGWLNKNHYDNIDEFIENVPFDETQNYIFKVYRTYWNYLNIYKSDKL